MLHRYNILSIEFVKLNRSFMFLNSKDPQFLMSNFSFYSTDHSKRTRPTFNDDDDDSYDEESDPEFIKRLRAKIKRNERNLRRRRRLEKNYRDKCIARFKYRCNEFLIRVFKMDKIKNFLDSFFSTTVEVNFKTLTTEHIVDVLHVLDIKNNLNSRILNSRDGCLIVENNTNLLNKGSKNFVFFEENDPREEIFFNKFASEKKFHVKMNESDYAFNGAFVGTYLKIRASRLENEIILNLLRDSVDILFALHLPFEKFRLFNGLCDYEDLECFEELLLKRKYFLDYGFVDKVKRVVLWKKQEEADSIYAKDIANRFKERKGRRIKKPGDEVVYEDLTIIPFHTKITDWSSIPFINRVILDENGCWEPRNIDTFYENINNAFFRMHDAFLYDKLGKIIFHRPALIVKNDTIYNATVYGKGFSDNSDWGITHLNKDFRDAGLYDKQLPAEKEFLLAELANKHIAQQDKLRHEYLYEKFLDKIISDAKLAANATFEKNPLEVGMSDFKPSDYRSLFIDAFKRLFRFIVAVDIFYLFILLIVFIYDECVVSFYNKAGFIITCFSVIVQIPLHYYTFIDEEIDAEEDWDSNIRDWLQITADRIESYDFRFRFFEDMTLHFFGWDNFMLPFGFLVSCIKKIFINKLTQPVIDEIFYPLIYDSKIVRGIRKYCLIIYFWHIRNKLRLKDWLYVLRRDINKMQDLFWDWVEFIIFGIWRFLIQLIKDLVKLFFKTTKIFFKRFWQQIVYEYHWDWLKYWDENYPVPHKRDPRYWTLRGPRPRGYWFSEGSYDSQELTSKNLSDIPKNDKSKLNNSKKK